MFEYFFHETRDLIIARHGNDVYLSPYSASSPRLAIKINKQMWQGVVNLVYQGFDFIDSLKKVIEEKNDLDIKTNLCGKENKHELGYKKFSYNPYQISTYSEKMCCYDKILVHVIQSLNGKIVLTPLDVETIGKKSLDRLLDFDLLSETSPENFMISNVM
mgnify:CR=1 FL=1